MKRKLRKGNMSELHSIQGFIIDLDGVIWRGDQLLPGVSTFFNELNRSHFPYIFATNNASTTPWKICQRAKGLGIEIQESQILTSSKAAINLLRQQLPEGAAVYVIGEEGIQEAIKNAHFQITHSADQAKAVVVGMDRKVNWEKMAEAAYAIANGAIFLGTNSDPSYPTERGLAPGNGVIIHALQLTTGKDPIVVGKPEPYLFLQAFDQLGTKPNHTLVVGDRLTTDILGGINAGALTALLLTGVTSIEDLETSSIQPDFVFETLEALVEALHQGP
jgi:4-nitrophenyl phosphatase